jgi:hypothetical protein
MFWYGLLAVAAVTALVIAFFRWFKRAAYVEEIVPFNWSTEQVEEARRFMEKERSNHAAGGLESPMRDFASPLVRAGEGGIACGGPPEVRSQ